MFVEHGALVHAGQARRAAPDRLAPDGLHDGIRWPARRRDGLATVGQRVAHRRMMGVRAGGRRRSPPAVRVEQGRQRRNGVRRKLLHRAHELFGRERRSTGHRGARPVAPAALGAREATQQFAPARIAPPRDPGGPRRQVARFQRAEEHAKGRGKQVQVFGIRQVGEEAQHGREVEPPGRHVSGADIDAEPPDTGGEQRPPDCPPARAVGRRRLAGRPREVGDEQEGDQAQDACRIRRPFEPVRLQHVAAVGRHGEGRERHEAEQVEHERHHPDVVRVGQGERREQAAGQRPPEPGRVEDEGPEDQAVADADQPLVEQPSLAEHLHHEQPQAGCQMIAAALGTGGQQQAHEVERPPPEEAERDHRERPQCRVARHPSVHEHARVWHRVTPSWPSATPRGQAARRGRRRRCRSAQRRRWVRAGRC